MILDSLLKVSAAAQITADAVSVSVIDIGSLTLQRKLGVGEPMALLVCITAVGTNTGSAKLQAIQSASATLGSGNQIIGEIDLAAADIVAGAAFVIPLGAGIPGLRYLGANYDITGTVDFTVDSFVLPLSMAHIKAATHAKGYTIS